MNYNKIYENLIAKSKNREKNSNIFYEKHHIIPKCIGGSNEINNLCYLTLREHFIAHLLLVEVYPNSKGLKIAVWIMCNASPNNKYNRYKPSSRVYARLKNDYREVILGRKWLTVSKAKGRKLTTAHRENIIKGRIEKNKKLYSNSTIDKLTKANKKEETGNIFSIDSTICFPKIPKQCKPVLQFTLEGVFIREWEGLTFAGKQLGIHYCSIRQACIKKSTQAGGYIWVYKNEYTEGQNVVRKRYNQKTLSVYDLYGNFLRTFDSVHQAVKLLEIKRGDISEAIRRQGSTKGFIFKY